jgi:uncharacterized protein YjgD (DUF1641 family)
MTNEEMILERLESIEGQLAPLAQSAKSMAEFKDDLTFLAQPATQALVKELADVEASFQLEDLMELAKRMLRSVRNITWSLGQLENMIDFVTTLEPLLKTSVPQIVNYLDDLEQRGVFRIIGATLDFRSKVAETYTPEDIDQIGDGLVALLNLAKKISDPQAAALLEHLAEVPASVDLKACKDVGPVGLLWACNTKEVKEGLGVLMELTKAMGKVKGE